MQALFEVASGSIAGREHLRVGKNNQDAYFSICNEQAAIAVVCDGCGSGKHSEVGAKIGARLVVKTIAKQIQSASDSQDGLTSEFWERLKLDLLAEMQQVLQMLGGGSNGDDGGDSQADAFRREAVQQIVNDYLLFTIVGMLITPTEAVTFSIGDGLVVVNGKIGQIGPFPDNAPPYLAYGLYRPDLIHFHIHDRIHTDVVESVLIGTDGAVDLMSIAEMDLPGKQETVGQISQFWQANRYFINPEAIHRRLSLINREVTRPDWQTQRLTRESGLLPDDTTLVVIRRKIEQRLV
jgi:hypothetical protein